jgi:hypothetical protein
MEPWSFKWFRDHVGLPSMGWTPSKTLQNCHTNKHGMDNILCGNGSGLGAIMDISLKQLVLKKIGVASQGVTY